MSKILITGASGLIGTRLTEMLIRQGYEVSHLGRKKRSDKIPSFAWDVYKGTAEEEAFHGVDEVIHLAGAGIADQRWTRKRKKEIEESRTRSTALLAHYLKKHPHIKTVVTASAIGYYGSGLSNEIFTEESNVGPDFLASVVEAWENEVNKIQDQRIVKLRIGVVLSQKGGALKEIMKPIKWGVGAPLGTGKQYMSWIHLDDLCSMFIKAVEDHRLRGVYNACGPYAVTNQELTKAVATALYKPLWLPAVPEFVIKILIGEMADLILQGAVVSSKKIQNEGFSFLFNTLEEALNDLLNS